jgi:hypothetical protein
MIHYHPRCQLARKEKGRPLQRPPFLVADIPRSGRRRDVGIVVVARTTGAAARLGLVVARYGFGRRHRGDGRRQDVERDPLVVFVAGRLESVAARAVAAAGGGTAAVELALGPVGTGGTLLAVRPIVANRAIVAMLALGPIVSRRAVVAVGSLLAIGPLVAVGTFVALVAVVALVAAVGAALVLILVVLVELAALRPLLFEAGAVLVQHAIIMLGVLEIIFGLDAVALHLRVASHRLVFFKQLSGIAAVPGLLAVAGTWPAALLTTAATAAAAAATASAAALTIVDQPKILVKKMVGLLCSTGQALPGRNSVRPPAGGSRNAAPASSR